MRFETVHRMAGGKEERRATCEGEGLDGVGARRILSVARMIDCPLAHLIYIEGERVRMLPARAIDVDLGADRRDAAGRGGLATAARDGVGNRVAHIRVGRIRASTDRLCQRRLRGRAERRLERSARAVEPDPTGGAYAR